MEDKAVPKKRRATWLLNAPKVLLIVFQLKYNYIGSTANRFLFSSVIQRFPFLQRSSAKRSLILTVFRAAVLLTTLVNWSKYA